MVGAHVFSARQLFVHASVQLPCLVNYCQACWSANLDTEYEPGNNREQDHHQRTKNSGNDEHLRAHALEVLAFDDCQKLAHSTSLTLVMKISFRLGSIISNLPIVAPVAIRRRSRSCALAPGANNASTPSLWRSILLTSDSSSRTPSPPSILKATEL